MTRMEPFRDRQAGKLSGGMKQKLALMCTLLHRPRILFLDEPTNGVDPVSRRDFWAILYQLSERRHHHLHDYRLPGRGRTLQPRGPDAQGQADPLRYARSAESGGRAPTAWRASFVQTIARQAADAPWRRQ